MLLHDDFRAGKTVIYRLRSHLVFTPKYRKPCLTPRVVEVLRAACEGVCRDFGATLLAGFAEAEENLHLRIEYPPKLALAALINSLKGVSARRLRTHQFEEVQEALWGDSFWSHSYCALSEGAQRELLQQYTDAMREAGPAGRLTPTARKRRARARAAGRVVES